MTLENLTSDDIAVLTELTIHHGMYRHECNYKYQIYYKIAGELLEEVIKRENKWAKQLIDEFVQAQIKTVKEKEYET